MENALSAGVEVAQTYCQVLFGEFGKVGEPRAVLLPKVLQRTEVGRKFGLTSITVTAKGSSSSDDMLIQTVSLEPNKISRATCPDSR